MKKEPTKKFEIPAHIKKKLKDGTWVHEQLESERTLQEILEFSEDTMSRFYNVAFHLYEDKRYEDAANAFLFLVSLNPYHGNYWLGLGAATQRCEQYETAIDAYEMAAICHLDSPVPYFHLSKCLFAMHDRESALKAIELALEYSEDVPEYEDLHRQALAAKATILKEQ